MSAIEQDVQSKKKIFAYSLNGRMIPIVLHTRKHLISLGDRE